jgi:hypothetical protein
MLRSTTKVTAVASGSSLPYQWPGPRSSRKFPFSAAAGSVPSAAGRPHGRIACLQILHPLQPHSNLTLGADSVVFLRFCYRTQLCSGLVDKSWIEPAGDDSGMSRKGNWPAVMMELEYRAGIPAPGLMVPGWLAQVLTASPAAGIWRNLGDFRLS